MMGVIYGVLASLFVSLYAIYIKRVLPVVNDNVWLLTFNNNINALIAFDPSNDLHLDYVVAGANLRAFNYGLPPNRDRAWIKSIVDGVTVPTFVPKSGVKIAVTDAEAQAQSNQDSTMGDDQSLEGMVEELKAGLVTSTICSFL